MASACSVSPNSSTSLMTGASCSVGHSFLQRRERGQQFGGALGRVRRNSFLAGQRDVQRNCLGRTSAARPADFQKCFNWPVRSCRLTGLRRKPSAMGLSSCSSLRMADAVTMMIGMCIEFRVRLEHARGLDAVHHRHAHVHQDEVGPLPARDLDALAAVDRLEETMAGVLEERAEKVAVEFHVVDDQHGRRLELVDVHDRRESPRSAAFSPRDHGHIVEGEAESAALARHAPERDLAAHHLDQALRDRQTQARAAVFFRALAGLLRERLEDARLFAFGDADAGVLDLQHEPDDVRAPGNRFAQGAHAARNLPP